MKIVYTKETTKEGKKNKPLLMTEEETITVDDKTIDKTINLIENLAAKVDIVGSINKLIDKIDLLEKINLSKTIRTIKKALEEK